MDALSQQWNSAPSWAKFITLAAVPTTGYAVARFLDEYRDWLKIGPGGLPADIRGFLLNLLFTGVLAKKETKSCEMYEQPEKYATGWKEATDDERKKAKTSFLKGELEVRAGKESNAIHFVIPQRERNVEDMKYHDTEVLSAYWKSYKALGDDHSEAIEWKTSVLERRGQAMFLKDAYKIPSLIANCRREVLHIHESDMSGHVLLSLADASEVLQKGWGERHRLTGTARLPLAYTMVYLPRTKEEIEVMVKILEAGIEYAKSNGEGA